MLPHYHPSSPTPRPEGVVEALAASPPIARRRRLNSCSSGAGQITGIAGWRRAPRTRHGSTSSLGMGMQSTPAKRAKSIDTIPWDSKATRRTEKEAQDGLLEGQINSIEGSDAQEFPLSDNTPEQQRSVDPQTPIAQWQDPLETTSETLYEIYHDHEEPLKLGTSSAPVTPRSSTGGKRKRSNVEQTPRGRMSPPTALSFNTHNDDIVSPNDNEQRTPTVPERQALGRVASPRLTPRPKLDLPPSDPPWSSTPSVFHDESFPKPRYRDTSSPSPPEIPRRRYSSVPPWELPLKSSPPSPLQLAALLDDDFSFPSSVPLPEYDYNAEREERALRPDPFGFSRIAAMVAGELPMCRSSLMTGRTPQVFLPSSEGEELPVRAYTPPRFSSPPTSPADGLISTEADSVRQSSPLRDRGAAPRKKKHYWLGERVYKRMERASTSGSEPETDEPVAKRVRKSESSKNSKKTVFTSRATPEPDPVSGTRRSS